MKQIKILSPCGILGYGFPKESFFRGLEQKPNAIVVDAGSTDAGPHKLGAGVAIVSDAAMKRDLTLMIEAAYELGIPAVIGSAGGSGARTHVEHTLRIIRDIVTQRGMESIRTAAVWADIDKARVASDLESGALVPLNRTVRPLTGERLEQTNGVVAQMGHEPILRALQSGFQLVVCGRAYDPSPFAAAAAFYGMPLRYGYHMGKILECAALCAVPGTTKDCMMGTISEDGFLIEPLSQTRACTPLSVAAHTFYEKEHPYILHGPGVTMDLSGCDFKAVDERTVFVSGSMLERTKPYYVKLEGALPAAYRTFVVAGVRDPMMIQNLRQIEQAAERQVRDYYMDILDEPYEIRFLNYGMDAVLGDAEFAQDIPHEVGLVFEVLAQTQQTADAVCATLRSTLLHFGYDGRKSTAGNLAFPFAPSDVSFGRVYEFSVYHLMPLADGELETLFPVEEINWKEWKPNA